MVEIDPDTRQVVKGISLPGDVDVPYDELYRQGDNEDADWGFEKGGLMYMARQKGLYNVDTEIVIAEESGEGLYRVLTKAWLTFETEGDGEDEVWQAYGGTDETMNPDPEHIWSVAETRAINRAIERALSIHQADPDGDGSSESSRSRKDPASRDSPDEESEYDGPPKRPEDDPESAAHDPDTDDEPDETPSESSGNEPSW